MCRVLFAIATLFVCCGTLSAQRPMYVVNGVVAESIDHIPHEDIESIDVLPADEQTIACWGEAAGEGVILVRLRYDTPARFSAEGFDNFTDYLASRVKWSEQMGVARISLRLAVGVDGRARVTEVLQATSRQLLRRVERAIEESPLWSAAMRDGKAMETIHLVNLQLPLGEEMPVEQAVIIL